MLEAAEKTVSCSFLCLGFVVSQSVMPVELFCCFAGQSALWRECVVVYVIIIYMPALFAFPSNVYLFAPMAKCGWLSSGTVNGPGSSAPEWLGLSGARLRGWLACGRFQTLLALMILSAGQQKGHPCSWQGCHSVGVAAAGWLESGSECGCVRRAEIEEAPDDGKRGPLALTMFRQ